MRKDTQKCIQEFKIKIFGNKKNIEKAEKIVSSNEVIRYIAPTNITSISSLKKENYPGVVILTNERIIFYSQVLNNSHSEILPVNEIRSIEVKGNSLTGSHIIIHAISKSFDFLTTYRKDILQKIQQTFDTVHTNSIPSVNISEADEIVKFKNLLDQGIITKEEFDAKKKQLLRL